MQGNAVPLAVLAQVALTLGLYVALAVAKAKAVKAGRVDLSRRALHSDAWPDEVVQINNNIRNQFELPVLFYVLAMILWQLDSAQTVAATLAWLFVASRILHAWIHTGSNEVPLRRSVFMIGWLVVLAMAGLILAILLTR